MKTKTSRAIKFLFAVLFFSVSMANAQEKRKKVAVVTFYVDKYVDASSMGNTAALISSISTLAEDPNFNLTPVLGKFHDVFFNEYSKLLPFDLIPESEVINNPKYQAFESKFGETSDADRNKFFQRFIAHEGYKPLAQMPLSKQENRNHNQMLEIFGDQVDGVMFVYLSYDFVNKLMPFTAGVRGFVNVKLWNKAGERVFAINEFGMSSQSVPAIGGIPLMKPEKLLPLCEDASDKIIKDLAKRLGKVTKKVDKKL